MYAANQEDILWSVYTIIYGNIVHSFFHDKPWINKTHQQNIEFDWWLIIVA